MLHEDTLDPAGQPPFANPCNTSQSIPSSIPQFLHSRPVLDWNHNSAITRTPIYGPSGDAQIANVGGPGSPVSGTPFQGNCAIGGTWYTGTNFPAAYQNQYYFADWGQGLIKTLTFDVNNKPVALGSFATNAGAVVNMVQHPVDGTLYYIAYDGTGGFVVQLSYTGNRTPVAVASADRYYGPTPLAVQFSSNGSYDPDGQPITYSWNFGDGSPVSTQANPAHTFTAPPGVPTKYVVTLTVTDSGNLSAQATLIVSVNNTPPNVTITSPVDNALYSPFNQTTINLTATVSDAESSDAQLSYQWQVLLHHNDHNHLITSYTSHSATAVLEATGCDGINIYYYRILLTVTDPQGLATTREVRLYPDCGPNTPPTISSIPDQSILQDHSTSPIAFTVGDAEMAPENLQLSAASSNPGLIPIGNIVFGGSGANRTVTVTPAAGQTGTATITVTVNDGPNNTSTNFVVTVSPAPPPPSLMAAYGFNEGSGTVVNDVSGNGNNGTISGATWTTSGKYGNALTFNGTNALVTVNNATSLQLTSAMTLEAWVYPTTVNSAWRDVIYKGNDNYYLEGTSSNASRPAMGGTFGADLYGTSALTANTWAHLAATYDGATMRLYVNGVQVASRAQTGAIATSTNPLQIGGDSLYGQYFAGRIDEVRIYNRALSAAEIQNDMNNPLIAPPDGQPPSAPGNLVATALGVSQVHLSWTASTDNVGVAGYLV